MLVICLIFIFFALLAVAYELHTMTARQIEIGTLIENFNRRDLRASGIKDPDDDDFSSESITKSQKSWFQLLGEVVVASLLTVAILGLLGLLTR